MAGEVSFKEKLQSVSFGKVKHKGEVRDITPAQVRKPPDLAWERGIAGERRPDGSFMPVLKDNSEAPMGIKEYSERRSELEAAKRRLHNEGVTPTPPRI